MSKHICIHGHFYQPPRENPWLEFVEIQDSSYPYHDWNARILAECYAPNTASRILDTERRIIDLVNNYSRMSFDFGPTLFAWMERNAPDIYQAVLEADKVARERFGGHGAAIAQAYNHMIMPLANSRDKLTQVKWGIADFEYRFGRKPEGMWLPETAVDLETLDIMAEQGIGFTILAPGQAKRVRRKGEKKWKDLAGVGVDSRIPYTIALPSGRTIAAFFYDGGISHDIAFGDLLKNGESFARRLVGAIPDQKGAPGDEGDLLVNIATDGETYGHHKRMGDMALAYCLYFIESKELARITNYAEFLEQHPSEHDVEIHENSSWSCVHGVERWRADCGCSSGMNHGWNQKWRAPLRAAMDWLRDNLAQVYETQSAGLFSDPWAARDSYVEIILDRSLDKVDAFLDRHAVQPLTREDRVKALKLLEMQRHSMLMFTSCGWFFDDVSGLESMQILQYAARAIQLAKEVSGVSLGEVYVDLLKRVSSNKPEYGTAAKIYEERIAPAILDLMRVGAHFGVSSLFWDYEEVAHIYTYTIRSKEKQRLEAGKMKLTTGVANVCSDITREESLINYAVLHMGDHNIFGGAGPYEGEQAFAQMQSEIGESFTKSELHEVMRLIDKHFSSLSYSLWHLFRDEQRSILDLIFETTGHELETLLRQVHDHIFPIMQAVEHLAIPLPRYFSVVLEFILNADIRRLLMSEDVDLEAMERGVADAQRWSVHLDRTSIAFMASRKIAVLMERWLCDQQNTEPLGRVVMVLRILEGLSLDLDLWKAQNIFFSVGKELAPEMREMAASDETGSATEWTKLFAELGALLRVRID
jgi:alpha-amylase/alpha-mannosidase (GH57 family)